VLSVLSVKPGCRDHQGRCKAGTRGRPCDWVGRVARGVNESLLFFFSSTEHGTHSFAYVRQVLYHLCNAPGPLVCILSLRQGLANFAWVGLCRP
jgi:hypothetical protein